MSRCIQRYDVKQLRRHSGCVPATRVSPETSGKQQNQR